MNKVDVNLSSVKDEQPGSKPDLRRTKTELFNKLIGNQPSQQMIVASPSTDHSKNDEPTNSLRRSSSLTDSERLDTIINNQSSSQQGQSEQMKNVKATGSSHPSLQQAEQLLPEELRKEPVIFSGSRSRWYTNEEVASILTNFGSHPEWQTGELQIRPKSGAVLLYSREKVRYRQDGYCWKKRKNGRTTREDHMKLKVQGVECIYGCYVHSAILPTFHRRCYWLLQNPDIVLVHYLNQPPDEQNKMMITFNPDLLEADTRRSWTNEEIIEEIGSVFGGISQIHHTLNINFPPATAILQQQQSLSQPNTDSDGMIESSPQSEQSQATTNSEANQDQVEMTAFETRQQQQQCNENTFPSTQDLEKDPDCIELMSICHDSSADKTMKESPTSANPTQICSSQTGMSLHQQQRQSNQDESVNMTFDVIVSDHIQSQQGPNVDERLSRREILNCFGYPASNILNANSDVSHVNDVGVSKSETSTDQANRLSMNDQQLARQIDQNPCSPVTQIYNKIVDDIETYALPLETDQFDQRHLHHHSVTMTGLPMEQISGETCQQHSHQINHVGCSERKQQQLQHQHPSAQVQYNDSSDMRDDADKEQSACSMDLATCDLFAENSQQGNSVGGQQVRDEDNLLFRTEFSLQSNADTDQVASELDSNVVDTLTNDDLRDLIMGVPSNTNSNQSNLLVDTNSLDLFNFKPSTWDQRRQQLDVKSTTSDTDALSRLSPMDQVPRCNSTGNTMIQTSDQRQDQQQHLSNSNFLMSHLPTDNTQANQFKDYQIHSNHKSGSANQIGSNSCSLSPSSSSLRATALMPPGPLYVGQNSAVNVTTQPFMRLPLQQRQKSEQKESCSVVLNSLLPKAISLDGSDLPSSTGHRLHSSPLAGYGNASHMTQRQPNLLLTPVSQHSDQQSHQVSQGSLPLIKGSNYSSKDQYESQHINTSLSPSVPLDAAGEFNRSCNYEERYNSNSQLEIISSNQVEIIAQKHPGTLLPILDYVPNWCNITGGAKVIIVGDWASLIQTENADQFEEQQTRQRLNSNCENDDTSGFFALFDNLLVPAALIQNNILRCYAPSHEPGFITLKVLYMNRIVSEQVLFEMRPSCVQPINQLVTLNPRDNIQQSSGQHSYIDNNGGGMGQISNSQNQFQSSRQQHRNSTSSTHSTSSSALVNQMSQASSSVQSVSRDNSKVLTLAENIISAMHKKNSIHQDSGSGYRLVNSLDMETSDDYLNLHQNCFRQQGFRNNSQRRMGGSRSLSRDSEPSSLGYGMNLGFMDSDPYWHRDPNDSEPMKPLTVMTDFLINTRPNNMMFGQKRHSSGSAGLLAHYQTASTSYNRQNGTGQMSYTNHPYSTVEWQMAPTETSSSGLGSVVSSLSPSNSSLHSPSSATSNRESTNQQGMNILDDQSPCSCGHQSLSTPTSADFCEYFQASSKTEESFASLTLNDSEQKELYEAAKIIQKAYRTYRGRKRQASELLVDIHSTDEQCLGRSSSTSTSFLIQKNTFPQLQQQPMKQLVEHQQVAAGEQQIFGPVIRQTNYYVSQRKSTNKPTQQPSLFKCYRDREMQAATIIQAYYRRYRQYVHYKRQQAKCNKGSQLSTKVRQQSPQSQYPLQGVNLQTNSSTLISDSVCERRSIQGNARLVVDTMSMVIDKATTSHVDRKRFKTALLMSSSGINNGSSSNTGGSDISNGNTNNISPSLNCTQRQQQFG